MLIVLLNPFVYDNFPCESCAGAFAVSGAQSGTTIKFNPVAGTDTVVQKNVSSTINIKHNCITCMREYESKSLEELRFEDYLANRKGPSQVGITEELSII